MLWLHLKALYLCGNNGKIYAPLISVEKALSLIDETVEQLNVRQRNVADSCGTVLVEDVVSPIDMPPFPQSAMDGYAIRFNETDTFQLQGEIKAGDDHEPALKPGEAVRIFTGAAVPTTASAVARQEDVRVVSGSIVIDPVPKAFANIRPQAEQIRANNVALEKGHVLNPASIGFLATLGITQVNTYAKPSVAILVTGNELVKPGTPLRFGQIYESNAAMLVSALRDQGIEDIAVFTVPDQYETTRDQLAQILRSHDLVLCSGGISVGDYDFVGKALRELGVNEVFYKVKQKPGKPLFFGKTDNTLVFALPGNPAAALTCFYIYVV